MSFDFLGTFNASQLNRYLTFARTQMPLIDARINHLQAEATRIGSALFTYTQGVPQQFLADPANSYIGRLAAAYEVLGGNPFQDLRSRAKTDPVFAVRGTEATPVQYMSNGEVIGGRGLADAASAEMMRKIRAWLDDTTRWRFDRLERKIRRAMDYVDQLQDEISYLTALKAAVTTDGSFEQVATELIALLTDPNYRAIFDDGGKDPFGLTAYAPFSSYDAVPPEDPNVQARAGDSAQRQNTGFVGPGETGTEATQTSSAEQTEEQDLGQSQGTTV